MPPEAPRAHSAAPSGRLLIEKRIKVDQTTCQCIKVAQTAPWNRPSGPSFRAAGAAGGVTAAVDAVEAGEPSSVVGRRCGYSPFSGSSGRIITPSSLAPVSGWVSPLPVRGASTSSGAQSYGLGSGTVTLL